MLILLARAPARYAAESRLTWWSTVSRTFPSLRSLTVLIATRNRASNLATALSHLRMCARPADIAVDVVVVDNGSEDRTAEVIRTFAAQSPIPVCCVTKQEPGLARARNAGLAFAQGDVVAVIDDDVIVAEDFLRRVASEFEAHDRAGVIGGRVELWDPTDQPFTILTEGDEKSMTVSDHPAGFIHGCNMSFRRCVLDKIGGFDERFGAGSRLMACEDTDFYFRALRAGFEVRYSPHILVYHNHGRKTEEQIRQLVRGYFISNGAFFAKHILRGDRDMLRMAYWDILVSLRALRAPDRTTGQVRWHRRKLAHYAQGFVRFLAVALRRASS
jgi:GT2 family glycosyltransferase